VQQIVRERARRASRSRPERGVPDQAGRLLRGSQGTKFAHGTRRIDPAPDECVKARVPEELIGILLRIGTGIAVRESRRGPAFPPVALEDLRRAQQYVGVRAHGIQVRVFARAIRCGACDDTKYAAVASRPFRRWTSSAGVPSRARVRIRRRRVQCCGNGAVYAMSRRDRHPCLPRSPFTGDVRCCEAAAVRGR
jgi:hypothetical protein